MDELVRLLAACDIAEKYRQDTVIVEIARIRQLASDIEDVLDEAAHVGCCF